MLSLIGHKQDSTLESEHIIDEIVAWFRIHEGKQQIKTIQTRRGWSDQAPALFLYYNKIKVDGPDIQSGS